MSVGTPTSCDMAGDVPSVFQVQCAVPSLLVVPGSVHHSAVTEPCSSLSGCVLMPEDPDVPGCPTCSDNNNILSLITTTVTGTMTTLDSRNFAVAGAKVWNSLPVDLRHFSRSLRTFGHKLKHYLFVREP